MKSMNPTQLQTATPSTSSKPSMIWCADFVEPSTQSAISTIRGRFHAVQGAEGTCRRTLS
jgi:hypothetical protein